MHGSLPRVDEMFPQSDAEDSIDLGRGPVVLKLVACNLEAMASNLRAMASNLLELLGGATKSLQNR